MALENFNADIFIFLMNVYSALFRVLISGRQYAVCTSLSILLNFSLDPEQKDILIEVIEKLLADKTTVRNILKIKTMKILSS